jgi:lysylphosphatidylglycerol synthetase-like protein (DUF2156 family)
VLCSILCGVKWSLFGIRSLTFVCVLLQSLLSYRTSLCLQYPPHQIAMSVIFLATLHLSLIPQAASKRQTIERTWFELLQPQEGDSPSLDKGVDEHTLIGKFILEVVVC